MMNEMLATQLAGKLIDAVLNHGMEASIDRYKRLSMEQKVKSELKAILSKPRYEGYSDFLKSELESILEASITLSWQSDTELLNSDILSSYLYSLYTSRVGTSERENSLVSEILREIAPVMIDVWKSRESFNSDALTFLLTNSVNSTHTALDTNLTVHRLEEKLDTAHTPTEESDVRERTDEYRENWNASLFLNSDPGFEVLQRDVYVPLKYYYKDGTSTHILIEQALLRTGGHLVFGHPGIGKSTMITWFLNTVDEDRMMVVYRMSDFNLMPLIKNNNLNAGDFILNQIGKDRDGLKNTIIFLDGFDECNITREERIRFILQLNSNWRGISGLSWVVTCRLNYIKNEDLFRIPCSYYSLLPLDAGQIQSFLDQYESTSNQIINQDTKDAIMSDGNRGIFGITLILYMVVALNLHVGKNCTMVEVYDHIFSLEKHGIYSRTYDPNGEHHPVWENRFQIHQMSRDIALWMFNFKDEQAVIDQSCYNAIEKKNNTNGTHSIGSYFQLVRHTEGQQELCFVHRTMYEYFLAEGFVSQVKNSSTVDQLCEWIASYFSRTQLTSTIKDYLKDKLNQNKTLLNYSRWEESGIQIVSKGIRRYLTDYFSKSIIEDYRIEAIAFWNLCELLRLIREITGYNRLIFETNKDRFGLLSAIRHRAADNNRIDCSFFSLASADLSYTNLNGTNLSNTSLNGANLQMSFLVGAYLNNSKMNGVIMKGTDLRSADLNGVELCGADLCGARLTSAKMHGSNISCADLSCSDLSKANLSYADLNGADLRGADLSGANLFNTNLCGARLNDAKLNNADLSYAVLIDADLRGAHLNYTKLYNTRFERTNLSGTHLCRAHLSKVTLHNSDLNGADIDLIRIDSEQLREENYSKFCSCRFENITIDNKTYSRNEFFTLFSKLTH